MSLANLITLARLPLLLTLVALLFFSSQWVQLFGLGLLIVLFLLDWFDGYGVRARHEVTEMGAVLNVALDRAVENILSGSPSCTWPWCPSKTCTCSTTSGIR